MELSEMENDDDGSEEQYEGNRGGRKQIKVGTTRRNARERNRVRHINTCFEILRQHIPHEKHNKKLSKVDTLKSAMSYIENLRQLLQSNSSTTTTKTKNCYSPEQSHLCFSIPIKEEDLYYWPDSSHLSQCQ